jgi:putative endonuclease
MGYNSNMANWCVYIIELSSGTYYTGITNDLDKRMKTHARGKGSAYVKANLPIVDIMYVEYVADRSEASKRESEIKDMRRDLKIKLANSPKNSLRKT